MATSIQGSSGPAMAHLRGETGLGRASQAPFGAVADSLFGKMQREPLVEYPAASDSLFGKVQLEPLVEYPAAILVQPRAVPREAANRALEAAGDSLFGKVQHEPLVEYPAAIRAQPRAVPTEAGHRACDVTLSLALLFLLWPVMLCAALLVRASGPGPIIFRHVRVGRNGTPFVCLKYRTMEHEAEDLLNNLLDASGAIRREWQRDHKIRRDPRVTTVGQILRRFSIDELPQLINVLRGEMSIVGPRPIVDAEIHRYAEHFADYCLVKPGLTGLWQVSGRNRLSYERRVELDCEYVRTRSLRGNAWIIMRTVPAVLQGSGC